MSIIKKISYKNDEISVNGALYQRIELYPHAKIGLFALKESCSKTGSVACLLAIRNSKLVASCPEMDLDKAIGLMHNRFSQMIHFDKEREALRITQEEFMAKNLKERGHSHAFDLGAIFYSSWGYDQTNIDWYQVVGFVGKSTLLVKEIQGSREYYHSLAGTTTPIENKFLDEEEPLRARVQLGVKVKLSNTADFRNTLYPYEGKPLNFSRGA